MFSDNDFGESLVHNRYEESAQQDSDKENSGREAPPLAGPALGVEDEEIVTRRRVYAKLDSEKLLSNDGIPRLKQKIAPRISFKGKGYEKRDLTKILGEYQLWAHRLYPKANFDDFIMLCRQAGKKTGLKFKRREWIEEEKRGPLHDIDANFGRAEDNIESWMGDSPPPSDPIDPIPPTTPPRTEARSSRKWSDDESDLFVTPKKALTQHEDNFGDTLFAPRATNSSQVTTRPRRVIADDDDDEPDDNDLKEILAKDFGRRGDSQKDNDSFDDIPADDELAELMRDDRTAEDEFAEEEAAMAAELGL